MEAALAVGLRDAKMFRHAGEIALGVGDHMAAKRYLQKSAALRAPGSNQARTFLASMHERLQN
jgi:hypothetical protein